MYLIKFSLLLLVQLTPIYIHVNGEGGFKCRGTQTGRVTVTDASAHLTNGCVQQGKGITFDLKAMYDAAALKNPKPTALVIDISHTAFINSYINLTNIPGDVGTLVPLLFTMSNSNMSGTSKLIFGSKNGQFKLPPQSRLRIINSKLNISATRANPYIFIFYSLQLVTHSSMEIAHNVIRMEYKGGDITNNKTVRNVLFLSKGPEMIVSGSSSFTLRDNEITINGHTSTILMQFVWFQLKFSSLTISDNSNYTWTSNIINIVGYNVTGSLEQFVWYLHETSALIILGSSSYNLASNVISILGYNLGDMLQYVWRGDTFNLTISGSSRYKWTSNKISIVTYNSNVAVQYVWFILSSSLTISQTSTYRWVSNIISMVSHKVQHSTQFTWYEFISTLTISDNSRLTWVSNNIRLLGFDIIQFIDQCLSYRGSNSDLTISNNSSYTWLINDISVVVYNVMTVIQDIWQTVSPITISDLSMFLFDSNRIQLLAWDYVNTTASMSHVMTMRSFNKDTSCAISGGSSMKWRDNCLVMGNKEADKRRVFSGVWTISQGSQLLLDGNNFTTTDKYIPSDSNRLTEFFWGPTDKTTIRINTGGRVTISNTQVHGNNGTSGASYSTLWNSSLSSYDADVSGPPMSWSSTSAKDRKGHTIPTLDTSNISQYMCGIPITTPSLTFTQLNSLSPSASVSRSKSESETISVTPTVSISTSLTESLDSTPTLSPISNAETGTFGTVSPEFVPFIVYLLVESNNEFACREGQMSVVLTMSNITAYYYQWRKMGNVIAEPASNVSSPETTAGVGLAALHRREISPFSNVTRCVTPIFSSIVPEVSSFVKEPECFLLNRTSMQCFFGPRSAFSIREDCAVEVEVNKSHVISPEYWEGRQSNVSIGKFKILDDILLADPLASVVNVITVVVMGLTLTIFVGGPFIEVQCMMLAMRDLCSPYSDQVVTRYAMYLIAPFYEMGGYAWGIIGNILLVLVVAIVHLIWLVLRNRFLAHQIDTVITAFPSLLFSAGICAYVGITYCTICIISLLVYRSSETNRHYSSLTNPAFLEIAKTAVPAEVNAMIGVSFVLGFTVMISLPVAMAVFRVWQVRRLKRWFYYHTTTEEVVVGRLGVRSIDGAGRLMMKKNDFKVTEQQAATKGVFQTQPEVKNEILSCDDFAAMNISLGDSDEHRGEACEYSPREDYSQERSVHWRDEKPYLGEVKYERCVAFFDDRTEEEVAIAEWEEDMPASGMFCEKDDIRYLAALNDPAWITERAGNEDSSTCMGGNVLLPPSTRKKINPSLSITQNENGNADRGSKQSGVSKLVSNNITSLPGTVYPFSAQARLDRMNRFMTVKGAVNPNQGLFDGSDTPKCPSNGKCADAMEAGADNEIDLYDYQPHPDGFDLYTKIVSSLVDQTQGRDSKLGRFRHNDVLSSVLKQYDIDTQRHGSLNTKQGIMHHPYDGRSGNVDNTGAPRKLPKIRGFVEQLFLPIGFWGYRYAEMNFEFGQYPVGWRQLCAGYPFLLSIPIATMCAVSADHPRRPEGPFPPEGRCMVTSAMVMTWFLTMAILVAALRPYRTLFTSITTSTTLVFCSLLCLMMILDVTFAFHLIPLIALFISVLTRTFHNVYVWWWELSQHDPVWRLRFRSVQESQIIESDVSPHVVLSASKALEPHSRRSETDLIPVNEDAVGEYSHTKTTVNHFDAAIEDFPPATDLPQRQHIRRKSTVRIYHVMQPFNDDDYVVAARQTDTSYTLLSDPRNKKEDTILKLNKWKGAFMAAHGRKPKASDMRADPEIAGIFAAYEKLKNEKKGQSENLPQETNPPVVFQSEQEAKESAERHSRVHAHVSNVLKRKLKEWKADFLEKNGRNPKTRDIEADSYAAPLFKEYIALSENMESGVEDPISKEVSDAINSTQDIVDGDFSKRNDTPQKTRQRRKSTVRVYPIMQPFNEDDYVVAARQTDTSYTLLSDPRNEVKDTILKLNKWKEAFMAAHGRKPKASDMRADLEIAGIFAAYEKLKNEKKRQSDNLTQETNPPVEFQSEQEAKESAEGHSREDDHASKILKRKLKEWKTDFIEKNGRNPKRSDIEADSYAAPLFKEYNTLS